MEVSVVLEVLTVLVVVISWLVFAMVVVVHLLDCFNSSGICSMFNIITFNVLNVGQDTCYGQRHQCANEYGQYYI